MLIHHGSQSYEEAASAAATHAREKLGALIDRGRTRAAEVIEAVQTRIPNDRIIRGRAINVAAFNLDRDAEGKVISPAHMRLGWEGEAPKRLHDHALAQIAERAGVPWRYAQDLRGKRNGTEWGANLLAHNLNEIIRHEDRRFLVRSIGGEHQEEVRGFLSDRFRRIDSRPILDEFTRAASAVGAVPIEGYVEDTRVSVKAILPAIFEPVPNEVMAFGLLWSNSDFGDGAHSLRVFMLRLFCTNYAITDEALRQVHLGGSLPDDVTFSERTYRLDTARSASMVRDIVGSELSPQRVERVCGLIKKANEEQVGAAAIRGFLAKNLGKGDADRVAEAFNSPDVENLAARPDGVAALERYLLGGRPGEGRAEAPRSDARGRRRPPGSPARGAQLDSCRGQRRRGPVGRREETPAAARVTTIGPQKEDTGCENGQRPFCS